MLRGQKWQSCKNMGIIWSVVPGPQLAPYGGKMVKNEKKESVSLHLCQVSGGHLNF